MARVPQRRAAKMLQMSVLDRLLLGSDLEPQSRGEQGRRLREAIRRDLEALFNTRPLCQSWPRAMDELKLSIVSYGLPDLQTRTVITDKQRESLRAELESLIRQFEPRLNEPIVELVSQANSLDRSLRFRIHGRLMFEAAGDAVVYDTKINPASREFRIATAERDLGEGR